MATRSEDAEPEYVCIRSASMHGGSAETRHGLAVHLPIEWVFHHGLRPRDKLLVEVRRDSLTIRPAKEGEK
jgi:hypothetical protein